MNPHAARHLIDQARRAGRGALFEHEAYAVLEAFGIGCPARVFVPLDQEITPAVLSTLPGDRVVVKAVATTLLHKTESGGVQIVERSADAVTAAARDLDDRLGSTHPLAGVLLAEFVAHERAPGSELLIAARDTREFGPVVTLGAGGVAAERMASLLDRHAIGAVSTLAPPRSLRAAVERSGAVRLAIAPVRGRPAAIEWPLLADVVERMLHLAGELRHLGLDELEVNPLVRQGGRLLPLDALATLSDGRPRRPPPPLDKMRRLLQPGRVALAGVSERHENPGRIILRNLLRDGFPADSITIVKPGATAIDGCRAVPSLDAVEPAVDLLVLAVGAAEAASLLTSALERRTAESIVLIPGGFEEKSGGGAVAADLRRAIHRTRTTPWRGPLVLGGNCLGIRSRPGRCDTLFIPAAKLPPQPGPPHPLAVVSQSGAFAIARVSRWTSLKPEYIITTGNQLDLTLGDCLEWLQDEPSIAVVALYVEGFMPDDGLKALGATARLVQRGGVVVVYRAGRTAAGARASASHTAAIAGDARVTRHLFETAGAVVADDIEHFEDLVRLACAFDGRRPGRCVGALSNAGFECVAIADTLGPLTLATFGASTRGTLDELLGHARLDTVVDVHNPLDLTPMAGAATYEAALRAVLSDDAVDVGVVGCVPLTGALHTLPAGSGHAEDLEAADALPVRFARVRADSPTPFVAVVDAGPLYDPLAVAIERQGLVVFRSADRAMRALSVYCAEGTDARADAGRSAL